MSQTPMMVFLETQTPLGNAGVYTGTARDARYNGSAVINAASPAWNTLYTTFNVGILASQASAANGAVIQGSVDGTNWIACAAAAVVANTYLVQSVKVFFPFYRVVLTNGATPQDTVTITSSFTR